MSDYRVFAWDGFRDEAKPRANGSRQTTEILAARTIAEAMRITGKTRHFFNTWVAETGNEEEVRVAMSSPGCIFWTELEHGPVEHDWRKASG